MTLPRALLYTVATGALVLAARHVWRRSEPARRAAVAAALLTRLSVPDPYSR